ncbi:MAG: glycogen debranching N-terminal domain-containing protein, partial [Ilumatobacteraceae bacterium]
MSGDTVTILDGSTFLVCDRRGDIEAGGDQPHGLFFRDTRFLSLWRLTLDGAPLKVLSTDDVDYFSSQFFLVPVTGSIYRNPSLSVIRQRSVGDGLHEDLVVLNHSSDEIVVELRVDADADFADIFEVKDALSKSGERSTEVRKDALVMRYQRGDFLRETKIVPSVEAQIDATGLSFSVRIAAHGDWQTCIDVVPNADHEIRDKHRHGSMYKPVPNMRQSLDDWIAQAPVLRSSWDPLEHIYHRSLVDLAALRFYTDVVPGASLPAAGLPWFMALFGRDSLLTSYQALPFTPDLAATTLRVLAKSQGDVVDGFRDEEPGKILHELRVGELTKFGERPQGPSFASADATPLFLILLEETERWTGDDALVKELEANARAAIDWIDNFGDRDGDGYVEYQTSNPKTGLENMCWKDSPNSIMFADGSPSKLPRATCEIQGYVYDA